MMLINNANTVGVYTYTESSTNIVRSIMPLPQVRATVSFSSRSSLDGYSGSFWRLKLEREGSMEIRGIETQEALPKPYTTKVTSWSPPTAQDST